MLLLNRYSHYFTSKVRQFQEHPHQYDTDTRLTHKPTSPSFIQISFRLQMHVGVLVQVLPPVKLSVLTLSHKHNLFSYERIAPWL